MSVSGREAALQCPSGTGLSGGSAAAVELPPGSSSTLPVTTDPAHRPSRSSAERLVVRAGTASHPSLGGLVVFNDRTARRLGADHSAAKATESVPLLRFGDRFRRQSAAILRSMTATGTPAVSLRGLRKEFGPVTAVAELDLDIEAGEFFAMLGPSGSGKTTVLRMIAGFERPTTGSVVLGGDDVTDRAPFARDVNTVFQDYALFPHMSVAQNVEYGLKVKRVARSERQSRAVEALQ